MILATRGANAEQIGIFDGDSVATEAIDSRADAARLTKRQWQKLGYLLDRGAKAAGYLNERWTLKRIAAVIERQFGVRYHPRYLERPLKAHGFTRQLPLPRARERDEILIAQWPKHEWVELKKFQRVPCQINALE